MACDGNWSEKDTFLPFLLSVVGWTFVLTKSCISSTREFTASFAPLVARSLRGSSLMSMRSSMGLVCKLAVASSERTTTIFDLHKVFDVFGDHCMMEDRVDHCSS